MLEWWEDHPPLAHGINEVRMMLRGFFGVKDSSKRIKKESRPMKEETEEEFRQKFFNFGRATGMIGNV